MSSSSSPSPSPPTTLTFSYIMERCNKNQNEEKKRSQKLLTWKTIWCAMPFRLWKKMYNNVKVVTFFNQLFIIPYRLLRFQSNDKEYFKSFFFILILVDVRWFCLQGIWGIRECYYKLDILCIFFFVFFILHYCLFD